MIRFRHNGSRGLVTLACMLALGHARPVLAFRNGIASSSFGSLGCNACHMGGQTPTVTIVGPTMVAPGSTNEFAVQISTVGSQTFGGFNVSSPFGTLGFGGADSSQTRTIAGPDGRNEMTHSNPKAASGAAVTFSFLWTAPDSFTSAPLNAWGNAVDNSFSTSGDHAAFAMFVVSSTMPGPNPTDTPTPVPGATPTPVVHDAVVSPVNALNVTLASGVAAVTKKLSVKVTNADPKSQTTGQLVSLSVTSRALFRRARSAGCRSWGASIRISIGAVQE